MKSLLWAFAVVTVFLLCFSIYTLIKQGAFSGTHSFNIDKNLVGFETSTEIRGLKELKSLYVTKLRSYTDQAEKNHKQWLWISFVVTALTAASTLVSSIKAASSGDGVSKKAVILIAVFTFLATLGSWGTGQLNEARNTTLQKISKIAEHRSNFYLDFQKANDDAKKEEVVQKYRDELDLM